MNPALMMAIMNAGRNSSSSNSNQNHNQNKENHNQAELLLLEREEISMRIEENQKLEVINCYYRDGSLYGNEGWCATINGEYQTYHDIGTLLETIAKECKPKEMQVVPMRVYEDRVKELEVILVLDKKGLDE